MNHLLTPGGWVRHPDEPGWGLGQIQSLVGERATVNFEHAGKRLINIAVIKLVPVARDDRAKEDD